MWNDSTPVGWFNTLLLLATTVSIGCWAWKIRRDLLLNRHSGDRPDAGLNSAEPRRSTQRKQFIALCCLMFTLAGLTANKQLDLQVNLTRYLRSKSKAEGWYAERRRVQAAFCISAAALSSIAVFATGIVIRRWPWPFQLAAIGFGLYVLFALLRLSSFSHVDHFLATKIMTIKLSRFVEPFGPLLILIASIFGRERAGAPGGQLAAKTSR